MLYGEKHQKLMALEACVEYAPAGTYEQAKRIKDLIGETCDEFMRALRRENLYAPNCDQIREIEASLYQYITDANPLSFATAEGFGQSMSTEARERIIGQAIESCDFFRELAKATGKEDA